MPKKLSDKQKEEIVQFFTEGKTIDQLSKEFNFTKLTIVNNLKKKLGKEKYKEFLEKSKLASQTVDLKKNNKSFDCERDPYSKSQNDILINEVILNQNLEEEISPSNPFREIVPLTFEIGNTKQKDLSSVPIGDVKFPNIVYMIVDKKIELKVKYLKDFPDWQFLSQDELNRKTIEIHLDLKIAKRFCKKEQKVIKVPNTDVFRTVAPILSSRGITRIISADQLIAL